MQGEAKPEPLPSLFIDLVAEERVPSRPSGARGNFPRAILTKEVVDQGKLRGYPFQERKRDHEKLANPVPVFNTTPR